MSGIQLNLGPLKEPLGFIKILEWVFSIFSFATCGGYSGSTSVILSCKNTTAHPDNHTIQASFMYPFRLNTVVFKGVQDACGVPWKDLHLTGDFSPPSEFYVTIGVFAFLYCMGALVLYLGYMHLYRDSAKLPLVDFGITVIFAFMWLVSSSAWAKGLTDIKTSTDPAVIVDHYCTNDVICNPGDHTSMRSLNISVVFGFLNLILWAGNAWFVYKETKLHSEPLPSDTEKGPGNDPPPSSM
ncbi:synaptophysin-like protein 1 [Bombina bombina]|uniref:synaptophysin-like protein 1 n=1 Tax=Bombina bombina TaxID=8345 RepID=UPI00235A82DE|nr:synaptophysin-like protein 1 [Bombina bombina]